MPSIIIALAGLCGPIQTFLHGSLPQPFVFGVDDGLLAHVSEIRLVAGERKNAGLAPEHLAAQGEIQVLGAVQEPVALLQIFRLDSGAQGSG